MAEALLAHATRLSLRTQQDAPANEVLKCLNEAISDIFPNVLFTISIYDEDSKTTCRVYTTRPDVQPLGARKEVTSSAWSQEVLEKGNQLYGPTIEHLKMFSEWQFLVSIGCGCVLNTPIRDNANGKTVGTLNILGAGNAYDNAPVEMAVLLGQLVAGVLQASKAEVLSIPFEGKMETV
ncbi:unnamed protein product [Clonostachys solani]|uniref:GAF domain-containing protein n=1 Tax=Clonostachys solani TaxID=160281 RepID=A0A9N9W9A7_9HYPO|nr:unnamed protein product [Clonostachys solani]